MKKLHIVAAGIAWILAVGVSPPVAKADTELRLEASKSYRPSRQLDGEKTFDKTFQFQIPDSIPVTEGKAGNHKALAYF